MTEEDRAEGVLQHPEDWVTADEPWTTAQRSYLHTLSREAGLDPPEQLTKAEASKLIDQLRSRLGME